MPGGVIVGDSSLCCCGSAFNVMCDVICSSAFTSHCLLITQCKRFFSIFVLLYVYVGGGVCMSVCLIYGLNVVR